MTRTIFTIIITCLFHLSGCTESSSMPVGEKIDLLNSSVEEDFESMNEEDWEATIEEFEIYKADFEENKSEMSQEERTRVNNSIGKFEAICAKRFMGNLKDELQDLGDQAESFVNEIFE